MRTAGLGWLNAVTCGGGTPCEVRDENSHDYATRAKINLEKVRAWLDTVCPKCGGLIPPAGVRRIDFERIECPVRGLRPEP
jgi:hypothetical protein